MNFHRRHSRVRIRLTLLGLLAAVSVFAAHGAAPKKRTGGFASPTPKAPGKKSGSNEPVPSKKANAGGNETTSKVGARNSAAPEPVPKTIDAESEGAKPAVKERAPAATVAPEEIAEFAAQPPQTQALIASALDLTKLNLTYTYGSADPSQGGMDCSGAIYYLLRSRGFTATPRDSSSQYVWTRRSAPFFAVVSKSADSFEFKDLAPGDLLFWTETYETGREIPISHVMLYLGTEKKTKKRIMFGSSDGRSYNGISRWGVSVFDFKMPKTDPEHPEKAKVDFVGYGPIPGLREGAVVPASADNSTLEKTVEKPDPTKKPTAGTAASGAKKKPVPSKKPARRD